MAEPKSFEVKSYPEMWKSLGMNVERFEKMRCVLGDVYQKTFMMQENRPKSMDYFDLTMSPKSTEAGSRSFWRPRSRVARWSAPSACSCPRSSFVAAGGVCLGLCGGSPGSDPRRGKVASPEHLPHGEISLRVQGRQDLPLFPVRRFRVRRDDLRRQEEDLGDCLTARCRPTSWRSRR